jgi:hypothetical protein
MGARVPPLYSALEDDPAQHEAIDRFVVELGQHVDQLQDLEALNRLPELGSRARELAERAGGTGYALLADAARQAAEAALEGKREATHDALVELTELARRVRLGHRGAA